ncbi:MAG: hypothetical protein AB4050_05190 [Synechococcus sp.]
MPTAICSTLSTYLKLCSQPDFTGVFNITNNNGTAWRLLFLAGSLVADAGGMFPLQRWQRQVARYRSNLPQGEFRYPENEWNYLVLNELIVKNAIAEPRAIKILGSSVCEILFEVALQELNHEGNSAVNNYKMTWQSLDTFEEAPLVSININKVWPDVAKLVERWDQKGWKAISPSSVPTVINPDMLAQLTFGTNFSGLPNVIDNNCTLWELAARLKCSIYSITRTIVALEQGKCIQFAGTSNLSDEEHAINEMGTSSGLHDVPTVISLGI